MAEMCQQSANEHRLRHSTYARVNQKHFSLNMRQVRNNILCLTTKLVFNSLWDISIYIYIHIVSIGILSVENINAAVILILSWINRVIGILVIIVCIICFTSCLVGNHSIKYTYFLVCLQMVSIKCKCFICNGDTKRYKLIILFEVV